MTEARHLSKRLETLIAMVPYGSNILDVGCDHGYVSIELIRRGIAPRAIASDLREGPLSAAREHIRSAGLADRMETVCCDGIPDHFSDRLHPPVTCLIAGMGGIVMRDILAHGKDRLAMIRTFLFSPQSDWKLFRQSLCEMGLVIRDESMVEEDGKFYVLILAEHGAPLRLSEEQLLFGPVLLKKKNPVLKRYLERQKSVSERILASLKEKHTPGSRKRETEVRIELEKICRSLSIIEGNAGIQSK